MENRITPEQIAAMVREADASDSCSPDRTRKILANGVRALAAALAENEATLVHVLNEHAKLAHRIEAYERERDEYRIKAAEGGDE